MTTTLFTNARFLRLPGYTYGSWLLVEDGRVSAIGDGDAPAADGTVSLDGAYVNPAFRDGHVHLPATGLYAAGLDLRGERSRDVVLDRFRRRAQEGEGILFGGNFEGPAGDSLSRHDLDRVVGDRPALLARADMHSCVVSTALLDRLEVEGLEGVDRDDGGAATGFLREKAAAEAWSAFDASLTPLQQKEAVRTAIDIAYSKGVAEVHEMFVVEWRGWGSAETFMDAIRDVALRVELWLGTDDVERVVGMGFDRIGGDYFLDGSFGSHSAWMHDPFVTSPPVGTPPNGISYRDDDDLFEFFLKAQKASLQTGVHAIGDAAISQALATWEKVAAEVGLDRVRAMGHRIEHFECATDDHIARAVALGIRASVQPAFDLFWGGEDGLYSDRIGWERARLMNRFGSMLEAGLLLGAGSDSTVTPLDPFLQMKALRMHHVEDERCGRILSMKLNSMGPALLMGANDRTCLEPGHAADFVAIDRDAIEIEPEELTSIEVLGTWIGGARVYPASEAEVA